MVPYLELATKLLVKYGRRAIYLAISLLAHALEQIFEQLVQIKQGTNDS